MARGTIRTRSTKKGRYRYSTSSITATKNLHRGGAEKSGERAEKRNWDADNPRQEREEETVLCVPEGHSEAGQTIFWKQGKAWKPEAAAKTDALISGKTAAVC